MTDAEIYAAESLYPMVEGLKRLDDKKIKLAIFRKIK